MIFIYFYSNRSKLFFGNRNFVCVNIKLFSREKKTLNILKLCWSEEKKLSLFCEVFIVKSCVFSFLKTFQTRFPVILQHYSEYETVPNLLTIFHWHCCNVKSVSKQNIFLSPKYFSTLGILFCHFQRKALPPSLIDLSFGHTLRSRHW